MPPLTEETAERLASYVVAILSLIFIVGVSLEFFGIFPNAGDTGAVIAGILIVVASIGAFLITVYNWLQTLNNSQSTNR